MFLMSGKCLLTLGITLVVLMDMTSYCMPTGSMSLINKLKQQDESRATTFNNPDSGLGNDRINKIEPDNDTDNTQSSQAEYKSKGEFCVVLCRTNPSEGGKMCSCDSYPMACRFNCS